MVSSIGLSANSRRCLRLRRRMSAAVLRLCSAALMSPASRAASNQLSINVPIWRSFSGCKVCTGILACGSSSGSNEYWRHVATQRLPPHDPDRARESPATRRHAAPAALHPPVKQEQPRPACTSRCNPGIAAANPPSSIVTTCCQIACPSLASNGVRTKLRSSIKMGLTHHATNRKFLTTSCSIFRNTVRDRI